MYMMARHYKGMVNAYELWNEENLQGEPEGRSNPAPYVDLLKMGYSGVKWATPMRGAVRRADANRREQPEHSA